VNDRIDNLRKLHTTLGKIELNRCFQAIDEIERLSAENSSLKQQLDAALELLGPEVETDPASNQRDLKCLTCWKRHSTEEALNACCASVSDSASTV